jgi:hypothetical protein
MLSRVRVYALVLVVCVAVHACVYAQGPTAEELKEFLQTPVALFFLMLFASVGSMLNQLIRSKRDGGEMTMAEYLKHWPEIGFAIVNNVAGWITLLMTDQLNYGSAIGVGFMANSLADQYRSGGRSADIAAATPLPEDRKPDLPDPL